MVNKKQREFIKERINLPGRKTYDEVFDDSTLKTLYKLMSKGVFDYLDFPISTGKEAKVFKAVSREGESYAAKIMRVNTAIFKEYREYIEGDHRFESVGKGRKLIFNWTKKEFSNLKKLHEGGVRVPEPITFSDNVLLMDFIEHQGYPAPMLKNVEIVPEDLELIYEDVIENYKRMINEVKLVHGDLSEYNILIAEGYPFIIDVSQGVPFDHPLSEELLERDIGNMVRYFGDHGVDTSKEKILEELSVNDIR